MEYLDLFLLHYEVLGSLCDEKPEGTWRDSWHALEALHADGKARAAGVSNGENDLARRGSRRWSRRSCSATPFFSADLSARVFCTARGWR